MELHYDLKYLFFEIPSKFALENLQRYSTDGSLDSRLKNKRGLYLAYFRMIYEKVLSKQNYTASLFLYTFFRAVRALVTNHIGISTWRRLLACIVIVSSVPSKITLR